MDTSETYVKMCDVPKIQEQSPCHFSYADNRTLFSSSDKVNIDGYRKGTFKADSEYNFFIGGWWKGKMNHLWLPRQDQIQGMIDDDPMYKKGKGWCTMPRKFTKRLAEFADSDDYNMVATSMEQLWLCFYMWKKHSKIWDGKEWEEKC